MGTGRELLTGGPPEPDPSRPSWWVFPSGRRGAAVAGVVALAAGLVAVLVSSGTAPWSAPEIPAPAETLPPGPIEDPRMTIAPPARDEPALPRLDTPLPQRISLDPAGVPPLSRSPVRRALAAYQRRSDGLPAEPVLVLGADGRPRLLDTVAGVPLTGTALSPDGTRLAFFRGSGIVVVDLADRGRVTNITGAGEPPGSRRGFGGRVPAVTPIDGFSHWTGDGALIATRGGRAVRIDPATGAARPMPYLAADLAIDTAPRPAAGEVELTGAPGGGGLLRRSTGPGAPAREYPLGTLPYELLTWYGPGRRSADLVARSAFTGATSERAESGRGWQVITVVDAGARAGRRTELGIPIERAAGERDRHGCCPVLGWYGPHTVLLESRSAAHRILAWDLRRGRVLRVAEFAGPATVTLARVPPVPGS